MCLVEVEKSPKVWNVWFLFTINHVKLEWTVFASFCPLLLYVTVSTYSTACNIQASLYHNSGIHTLASYWGVSVKSQWQHVSGCGGWSGTGANFGVSHQLSFTITSYESVITCLRCVRALNRRHIVISSVSTAWGLVSDPAIGWLQSTGVRL